MKERGNAATTEKYTLACPKCNSPEIKVAEKLGYNAWTVRCPKCGWKGYDSELKEVKA